ncbi:hypothetical protein [Acinetobacter stercoris]|uniref:Uncharacterized protein n=1 Tax=Acinetobacter stercoris TaxID=2126983 RepID=A0A2U3N203_9GAMM|nr:hypothetical protein [Acinetobacter stercoris]SPL71664.1 hypothetical protein KPC_2842 [Acinetobacter stercoris]
MQFFDLGHQFNLNDILLPTQKLDDLQFHDWFLRKVRVEYDCLNSDDILHGQAVIQSDQNIQIELEWAILDTGHELQVTFKGIETIEDSEVLIVVKGAKLVDQDNHPVSTQILRLWIEGTLLPLLPHIKTQIKSHLNLWDYVEYDG